MGRKYFREAAGKPRKKSETIIEKLSRLSFDKYPVKMYF
jgi:hypothetical protein